MEKRVKAMFYEMIDRYRENKHEFDDESLALLHDVYGEAYKAGYEDALQDSLNDPEQYPPEEVPDKPDFPELPDLKAGYYELFPDSNERTRQRDFEELNRAGFKIYYERKYKAFLFEYDEYTGELMDI